MIYLIFLSFLLVLSRTDSQSSDPKGRLKISIGTTAGCGDCVTLIRDQVPNVYAAYADKVDFEFVPWGKTKRSETNVTELICQFGPADCLANDIMRCALSLLNEPKELKRRVDYAVCEFKDRSAYLKGTYACAESVKLDLKALDHCVTRTTETAHQLSLRAEKAAKEPMAAIKYVPTIVLGDNIDVVRHWEAFRDLNGTVYELLQK